MAWAEVDLRACWQRDGGPPSEWLGSLAAGHRDQSGHIYMRNRYYDPGTGQFTQRDPIGLAGGLNLYGFAGGDPINFWDPFGLCPRDVGGDGKTDTVDDCPQDVKDAWADKYIKNTSTNNTDLKGLDAGLWDAIVRASMAWRTEIGISGGKEDCCGHSVEGRHPEGGGVDINTVGGVWLGALERDVRDQVANLFASEIVNRLGGRTKMVFTPGMAFRFDRSMNASQYAKLLAAHATWIHITVWP